MLNIAHKTIKTENLNLRRPLLTDIDDIYKCTSDGDVCKYELWNRHETPMETFAFLNELICRYDEGECFDWIIESKKPKRAVGIINLHDFDGDTAFIGYWLAKDCWNKGFASEAVSAVIQNCFNLWGFETVYGSCHPANVASIKVLEKCGFAFSERVPTVKFGRKEKNLQTDCIYCYEISNTKYFSQAGQ